MWKRVFLLSCILALSFNFNLVKGDASTTTERQLESLKNITTFGNNLVSAKKVSTNGIKLESRKKVTTIGSKLESLKKLTGRIVNGTKAVLGQFPQQVSLRRRDSRQAHFCGASILTPKWVLSAAHCVWLDELQTLLDPKKIVVVAGEIYLKNTNTARAWSNVLRLLIHPKFDYDTLHNDLSLLELETPICFNNYVHSVPIARKPTQANAVCQVSGWGYRKFQEHLVSNELLYVDLPIVDIPLCQKLMQEYSDIPKGMMCAGYMEGGRDACQGDSGGGLVCSGLLTGVVSGGQGCAWPRLPGLYADIHVYADWIEKYVDFSKKVNFCSSASTFALPTLASVLAVLLHIAYGA